MSEFRWPTYAFRNLALSHSPPEPLGSLTVCDDQGRLYLDAVNGVGCAPLGHGHPGWAQAVADQAHRLAAVANSFTTAPQQQLVQALTTRFPVADARAFLASSGTEATEAAIKLALRATGRSRIVVFDRAFHGRTLGALALTANAAYRQPYIHCEGEDSQASAFVTARVLRLPFGDTRAVEAAFAAHAADIAAVFVEPIQGEAGVFPATREFLVALRELCSKHGALLGADEIQCGSGRTGTWSAWSQIVGDDPADAPDILWLAKALGGGIPIGVCLARAELVQAMAPGSHGTTFGGNPLACAAALATIQTIESEGLLAHAAAQLPTLREIAQAQPLARVREIRGLGAMIGIEVGNPDETIGAAIGERLMHKHQILVTVCGGRTIRLLLPYRAAEPELRAIWQALGRCLEAIP